jgi:hypothetical protein
MPASLHNDNSKALVREFFGVLSHVITFPNYGWTDDSEWCVGGQVILANEPVEGDDIAAVDS